MTTTIIANDVREAICAGTAISAKDQRLLDSAMRAARDWARSLKKVKGAKAPVDVSPSRDMMIACMETMVRLSRGVGSEVGLYNRARAMMIKAIGRLNFGRVLNDLEPLSVAEIAKIYASVEQHIVAEEERDEARVLSLMYAGLPVDDRTDADFTEIYKYEKVADNAAKYADWSESYRLMDAIIKGMDPHGHGFPTHPLPIKNTYLIVDGVKTRYFHPSVYVSLFWLGGSKGKHGFVSDPRFTQEHREILIDFLRAGWDNLKKNAKK